MLSLAAHPAVLSPAGTVASQQRDLMLIAGGLSLLVVVPVFAMAGWFVWRYREGHNRAYQPEWGSSRLAESLWWGGPLVLIVILAVITWTSTHQLDPYRPLASRQSPLEVQVVALQWKWLFIYPQEGVASLDYVRFPAGRPVAFTVTADAPMNSFWVPQLGGQIYAMAGMSGRLYLMADQPGKYRGVSANLSGSGFSHMSFVAEATSQADYDIWVNQLRQAGGRLDYTAYTTLAEPNVLTQPIAYGSVQPGLYTKVVERYQHSHGSGHATVEARQ